MVITREELETQEPDARSELIRALVPLGLAEIERTLQEKVRELGRRAVRAG